MFVSVFSGRCFEVFFFFPFFGFFDGFFFSFILFWVRIFLFVLFSFKTEFLVTGAVPEFK